MALASGGTLGTGTSSTSASSFTHATATNTLAAGDFAILNIVTDNLQTTTGTSNDHTGVSGTNLTATKLYEYTNGQSAAGAGVTTSVWLLVATGSVGTGSVITMTLSGAVVDKVSAAWKYTKGAGMAVRMDPSAAPVGTVVNLAANFGSASFSGLASKQRLYFRGLGKEVNSTTALTVTTNFTATTPQRSRNNAAAVIVRGEFRINTSTGETSNPTFAGSADGVGAFVALEEYNPNPVISTQPKNAFVIDGQDAAFSLAASNYTEVQWQELIASGGGGTVSLGSSITAVNTSATVATFSTAAYNQAAGDALAVRIKWEGTATPPTGVTDTAGNTYVARTARLNGTAGVQIFDCMSTLASATNVITVTWPGVIASYISLAPIRFTITGAASFVAEAGSPTSGTGTAVATGTFAAGDFAVAEVGTAGTGATGTAGTGWTEDVEHGAAVGAQSMYRVDTPGGTIQALSTLSVSSPWFAAAVAYTVGAGSTWTDLSGETGTSLDLSGVTTADDGRQFRAKLTNAEGETITNIVTLYVSADGLVEYHTETTGGVESATTAVNVPAIPLVEGELDILIIGAGVIAGAAPTMATPAGYTKAGQATDLPLAGVVNTTLCLFWRNATEGGAVIPVTAGASSLWGWTRIAYRYHDPADPIEAFDLGWLAASTAHVLPGYSASKPDHMYVGWVSQALAQGGTVPPPMVRRVNDEAGGIVLGDEQIAATGATGTRTITVAASADTTYAVVGVNSLASIADDSTNLAPADLAQAHSLDVVALTLDTTLGVADMLQAQSLDAVVLSTQQQLAPADLAHGHTLDAVTLTTSSATSLVPADMAQSQTLDAVALTLDTHLAPADLAQAHALDAVVLSTLQPLSVADLSQGQTLDAVVLTTTSGATLEPADMLQGHTLEAIELTTVQPLTMADLLHTHSLDAVALSTQQLLALSDLAHAHTLDSPAVNTALSLALADLLHAHSLDAVALSSATSLAPADMAQGHALESTVLSSLVVLAMADLLHAHTLDAVTLSTDDSMTLNVADMLQAHTLESPTLVTEVGLTVARLVHTQSLEGVTLGALTALVVADLLHAHSLDAVTLQNVPALQVARLTQAHTLDSVTLSALATLVVSDMLHAHRLEGVTLSGDDVETERALIVQGRPRVWRIEGKGRMWVCQ